MSMAVSGALAVSFIINASIHAASLSKNACVHAIRSNGMQARFLQDRFSSLADIVEQVCARGRPLGRMRRYVHPATRQPAPAASRP